MQSKENIVGHIYGEVRPTEFKFSVYGESIRKFDYIYAPHKEGRMLAQVMDITQQSNLKSEDVNIIMQHEEKPIVKTKVIASVDVIGYRDKQGLLQSPRTPFNAGSKIHLADEELIRNVLGLNSAKENGVYIGLLKGHNLPVFLNVDTLVQKHICILAKTGGGKSYACGVLVEELLKHKIPLVIIDTHGEYQSLQHSNNSKKEQKNMERYGVKKQSYKDQINEFSPLGSRGNVQHLTLNGINLSAGEILDLLPAKLSGPQKGVLYQAIKEIKEYKTYYTIRDIIETVSRSKSNARWNAIASLESLDSIGVFSEHPTQPKDLVKKGKASIINMKGVPPDVQAVVVARMTKQLFDERKANKIPPFLLIVEEAHNYCPEKGFGNAVSLPSLRTIASEGRKFGMGLCVVSQRPAKVDKNIISQCNTNIILKVTNPNDLKAIIQSVEGLTTQAADEIQRLPIGVALIAGGSLQMPILAEIRTRETSHGGRSVSISKSNQEIYKEPVIKTEPQTSYPTQSEVDQTINYQPSKNTVTEKAKQVTRVANRLGWVKSSDPEEAIKILAEEAQKMDENVYKYLESLSNLGKKYCFENNPQCMKCPMNNGCNYQLKLYKKPRKGLFRK
jgi:DNA helicase HerA-like ATPase